MNASLWEDLTSWIGFGLLLISIAIAHLIQSQFATRTLGIVRKGSLLWVRDSGDFEAKVHTCTAGLFAIVILILVPL